MQREQEHYAPIYGIKKDCLTEFEASPFLFLRGGGRLIAESVSAKKRQARALSVGLRALDFRRDSVQAVW